MFERDKLDVKAIKSKTASDWNAYKTAGNVVSSTLKKDKQLYYSNRLYRQKHNPKEAWQTINRILVQSQNNSSVSSIRQKKAQSVGIEPGPPVAGSENVISDINELAETFNEYFSTIGDKNSNSVDTGNIHFSAHISKSTTTFEFDTVSVDKVLCLFFALSSSKATGIDKIPAKVLKLSIYSTIHD